MSLALASYHALRSLARADQTNATRIQLLLMSEAEDREEARQKEFSLLRPELDFLDLVTQREEDCPAQLRISNTTKTHDCTRPAGHSGQHYSFSGENEYEIIWPIVPPTKET